MIVVGLARYAGRALAREVLDELPRPEHDDSGEGDEGEGFADHDYPLMLSINEATYAATTMSGPVRIATARMNPRISSMVCSSY